MKKYILKIVTATMAAAIILSATGCGKNNGNDEADMSELYETEESEDTEEQSEPNYEPTEEILSAAATDYMVQIGDTCVQFPTNLSTLLDCGVEINDSKYNPDYMVMISDDGKVELKYEDYSFDVYITNDNGTESALKDCSIRKIEFPSYTTTKKDNYGKEVSSNLIYFAGGLSTDAKLEDFKNVWTDGKDSGDTNALYFSCRDLQPQLSDNYVMASFSRADSSMTSLCIDCRGNTNKNPRYIYDTKGDYGAKTYTSYEISSEYGFISGMNENVKELEFDGKKYYLHLRAPNLYGKTYNTKEEFAEHLANTTDKFRVYSENDSYLTMVSDFEAQEVGMPTMRFYDFNSQCDVGAPFSIYDENGERMNKIPAGLAETAYKDVEAVLATFKLY